MRGKATNSLDPQDSDNNDIMEGIQLGNGKLGAEERERMKGKKAKSKSKSKKSRNRSKRAADDSEAQEAVEHGSTEDNYAADEGDAAANGSRSQDAHSALLEDLARSAKKGNGKASKRKKLAKLAAELAAGERVINGDDAVAGDLAQLPRKMKKAKKAKSRNLAGDSHARPQEDSHGLDEVLHQPLTPAHQSHYPVEVDLEDRVPESSMLGNDEPVGRAAASNDEQEGDQQRPSKKALGKRRATDNAGGEGRKKRARKSSSKESYGQDLRQMFDSQQRPDELGGNTSLSTRSPKQTSGSLNKSAVNGLDDVHMDDNNDASDNPAEKDIPDEQPELPFEAALLRASEIRKRRKRRLPVDDDESGPSSKSKTTSTRAKIPRTPKSLAKSIGTPPASTPKRSLTVQDTTGISRAIESYRDYNHLTQRQVNDLIQKSAQAAESRDLWTSIYEEAQFLPRRSVQQFCRRNFHNFEGRGIWTEEQDEELREAYQRHPRKWAEIGQELNRFAEDVRDRWRNYLVCDGNMKMDTWDQIEVRDLLAAVEECIRAIRDERQQTGASAASRADEEKLVDWQKVSEKMNHTRSRLQCRYKWKKLKNFNGSEDERSGSKPTISRSWRIQEAKLGATTMSAPEKLRLLRAIHDSGAGREGKIPWAAISRDLNEKGKRMIWKVCFRKLTDKLPGSGDMEFDEIVKRLVEIFEASAPNDPEGFEIDFLDDPIPSKKKYKPRSKTKAKRKQDKQLDATNGEGPSSVTKANRKVRGRMRRQDESTPEPSANSGDEAAPPTTKGNSRKSKFLSEEKIVEDPSDEEDGTNEQTDQGPIEVEDDNDNEVAENSEAEIAVKVEGIDTEAHETESVDLDDSSAATPNRSGSHGRSDVDEDESAPESADETQSVDLDEGHTITANGFDDPKGPEVDEDEATSTTSNDNADSDENEDTRREDGNKAIYHRLANRHVETYFDNAASDSESSDSSGSSASSIPARVRRNVSIEL